EERLVVENAGIVHEDIDAVIALQRLGDEVVDVEPLRDIAAMEDRLTAPGIDGIRHLGPDLVVDVGDEHLGSLLGQTLGASAADPLGRSGDNGNLSLEQHGVPRKGDDFALSPPDRMPEERRQRNRREAFCAPGYIRCNRCMRSVVGYASAGKPSLIWAAFTAARVPAPMIPSISASYKPARRRRRCSSRVLA